MPDGTAHSGGQRATRPQSAGAQASAVHAKKPFPLAHGNIDIFAEDDAPVQKKTTRPPAAQASDTSHSTGLHKQGQETPFEESVSIRKSRPAARQTQGQSDKASSGGRVMQQDAPKATRPPLHRAGEAEHSSGQTAYMEKKNSAVSSSVSHSNSQTVAAGHAARPLEATRAESASYGENTTRQTQKRSNSTYEQGMGAVPAARRFTETMNYPLVHSTEKQVKKSVHTARQQTMPKNGVKETPLPGSERRPPNGRKR